MGYTYFRSLFKVKGSQKGFTLLELLIVIAVLGVLSAIAVVNVPQFISGGYVSAANDELTKVNTAVYAYSAEHGGNYPADSTYVTGYFNGDLKATYYFDTDGDISGYDRGEWPAVIRLNTTSQLWERTP